MASQAQFPDAFRLRRGHRRIRAIDDEGIEVRHVAVQWYLVPSKVAIDNKTRWPQTCARSPRPVLDAFRFDPQKVGKNEGSYDLIHDAYETLLGRQRAQ